MSEESVRAKLRQARRHFELSQARWNEWESAGGIFVAEVEDPKVMRTELRLGQSSAFPTEVQENAADAAVKLRSALDHLAAAAAKTTPKPPRLVYFPIAREEDHLTTTGTNYRWLQDLPAQALELFRFMQGFEQKRPRPLARLAELTNADKHHDLSVIVMPAREHRREVDLLDLINGQPRQHIMHWVPMQPAADGRGLIFADIVWHLGDGEPVPRGTPLPESKPIELGLRFGISSGGAYLLFEEIQYLIETAQFVVDDYWNLTR